MLSLCKSFQIYLLPWGVIPWKETWFCIFQHRKADSEEFLQLSPWQCQYTRGNPWASAGDGNLAVPLNVTKVWHFHDAESSGCKRDRAVSSGRCSAAGIKGWKLWADFFFFLLFLSGQEEKDDIILSYAVSLFVSWCPARVNIITSNPGVSHPKRQEKFPHDRGDFSEWHSSAEAQDSQLPCQHLPWNEEGWWVFSGKMVLRLLIFLRAARLPCKYLWSCSLPSNSKPAFFLPDKSKLEKWAVSRREGRELAFPSSCSASKLFSSMELPVELTQLLSGEKQREAQLTDHFPSLTHASFSACKSLSWTLETFFELPKTIKWVHLEYTGQECQH